MPLNIKRQWSKPYFYFLIKYRYGINLLALLLAGLSFWGASHLALKTNFSELLPQSLPSVRALKQAGKRIGGTGQLNIGVESPNFEANKKFVEALIKKVQPLVGTSLRYYEYRYKDVEDYLHTYGLFYLSLKKLNQIEKELRDKIEIQKDKAIGLGLEDELDQSKKNESVDDWVDELDPQLRSFIKYREAYLSADEGKILVVSLQPTGSSLGVEKSSKLVNQIKTFIHDLDPKSFQPKMKVQIGGSVQSAISEYQTIRHDIFDTALLLVVLILSVIVLFFWSFRLVALLVASLIFSVAYTFGLTELFIGYLNTQTAFLGSLVVGTGINYGIILLYRFTELRRSSRDLKSSLYEAIGSTAIPTLIASSTTAVSFLSLFLAQNKGLSQFGFIGCTGIFFCWVAAYSLLPLWLYQWENRFPIKNWSHPLSKKVEGFLIHFGNHITKRAAFTLGILILISSVGAIGFYLLVQNPVEYNFDNLRNKVALKSGPASAERQINKVFTGSTTPSLVLLDNQEEAKEICPTVRKMASSLPPDKNIIHSCMSLYELLPKVRGQKVKRVAKMKQIKKLLDDKLLRFSTDWKKLAGFQNHLKLRAPSVKNLPPQLVRRFTEKNGRVGTLAYIYPDSGKPLNDGRNLLNFTESLTNIHIPKSGAVLSASGDSFILADLLRGLKRDGPLVSTVAFVCVVLIAMFLAGGVTSGLLMAACLIAGTWWLLCFQGLIDIKYNFFNFIALPLTFGIGVDYPINVYVRCRQEHYKDFGKILSTSGSAVILCSLTTIIGYYTLLYATNLALVSFAKLALIGEFACLAAAVILLPALLSLLGKFKQPIETKEKQD